MAKFIMGIGVGMILTVNLVAYVYTYDLENNGKVTIFGTTYSCEEVK